MLKIMLSISVKNKKRFANKLDKTVNFKGDVSMAKKPYLQVNIQN